MRITWLVLGVVLAAGAVAFINSDEDPAPLPEAASGTAGKGSDGGEPAAPPSRPALKRNADAQARGAALSPQPRTVYLYITGFPFHKGSKNLR